MRGQTFSAPLGSNHVKAAGRHPRKSGIDHRSECTRGGVVPIIERQVFLCVADGIAVHLLAPVHRASHRLRVRVENDLVVVEAMSTLRLVRAVHPVPVELTSNQVR